MNNEARGNGEERKYTKNICLLDLCKRFEKIDPLLSKYRFELKFIEEDGAWAEFDLGETSFALLQRPAEKGSVQSVKTRIMFEVNDIEEMRRHLVSLGVKLIGDIREEPYGKLLTFEDPDGHWLEFFEN